MASFLERYHQLTKYDPRTIDTLGDADWGEQPEPWKPISGGEHIDLRPYLTMLTGADQAGSDWHYATTGQLDLAALARIAWFAAGINGIGGGEGQGQHLARTNPAAGGLYPVELYWAVFDVPGLEPGIWMFHGPAFSLIPVWKGDFRGDFREHFLRNPSLEGAGAVALLTGIFGRGRWRYKERAWRRMLLDAGHLLANLQEAGRREGLDTLPLSGFVDEGIGDLLFPEEGEVPLLGVAVGRDLDRTGPRAVKSPPPDPERLRTVPEPGHMQEMAHALGNIPLTGEHAPVPDGDWIQVDGPDYVPLPKGIGIPGTALAAVLRRSCRAYRGHSRIDLQSFGAILEWSYAPLVEGQGLCPPGTIFHWIAVLGVDGLEPGIWHYDPNTHAVALCKPGDFRKECRAVSLGQELSHDAAFVLFQTTELGVAVATLGERAYRPLCMDAGLVGERLNLSTQALGLGSSGIGGYFDDLGNELLDRPLFEALIYVSTVGVPG